MTTDSSMNDQVTFSSVQYTDSVNQQYTSQMRMLGINVVKLLKLSLKRSKLYTRLKVWNSWLTSHSEHFYQLLLQNWHKETQWSVSHIDFLDNTHFIDNIGNLKNSWHINLHEYWVGHMELMNSSSPCGTRMNVN